MARPKPRKEARDRLPLPPPVRIGEAFVRLARQKALQTLIRGALPVETLKRLLRDALPRAQAREMPLEVWASLAAGIAYENPPFGLILAETLHDRLAWDREPASLDDWWRLVRERPLEALWMAALSDAKPVKKEFAHIAEHSVENFRDSPECEPPSWEFVEAILGVQAANSAELREIERQLDDAGRRLEAERQRLDELREELKRLRRENAELRGEKAQAERRVEALAGAAGIQSTSPEPLQRLEELTRRLRKAEKENEHLARELARRSAPGGVANGAASLESPPAAVEESARLGASAAPQEPALAEDPNPRRRVLRQMLRKLVKKGKIGASHTHEDNVYRGVPDHEKGIAKEAMELLYREGLLVPKPTTTDPHVSVKPERLPEVRAIIGGEIANSRLARFIEGVR